MRITKNQTLICSGVIIFILLGVVLYLAMNKKERLVPVPVPTPPPQQQPPAPQQKVRKPSIVFFHAKWCGNCTTMLPNWKQFEQQVGPTGIIDIISLEDSVAREEMSKQNIKGFPTIRFYPGGYPSEKYVEYKGNRSTESLIEFLKSQGAPL